MALPHGVLEQLGQDVVQRQRDEREASRHVSVDPHSGGVAILVLAETPVEGTGGRLTASDRTGQSQKDK